jgi:ferredoxin--NADP+ reductase
VIVGAGPAGLYAADALTYQAGPNAEVDVLDRLPTPFGLLRYGVAPDHFKMKSLEKVMQRIIDRPSVRFLGNVALGTDVTRADLLERYDAVIYAYGAPLARRLNIAGEELPGSAAASDFVAWYNGHPECSVDFGGFVASSVAIIGMGNVALDVARILLMQRDKLPVTDIADRALRHLVEHRPTDVYIVGRRGVAQARFTLKELREIGDLEDVAIIVDPDELAVSEIDVHELAGKPDMAPILQTFHGWAKAPRKATPHRLHFRFLLEPERIQGTSRVEAIRLQRMTGDSRGVTRGTGEYVEIRSGAVIRSLGQTGRMLPDIPFDPKTGTVPNVQGRVAGRHGPAAKEFVTGWARRGSTGVIGNTRGDAAELAELIRTTIRSEPEGAAPPDLIELLAARGVQVVTAECWSRIDRRERDMGKELGRPRVKLESVGEMLSAARAVDSTTRPPGPRTAPQENLS